MDPDQTDQNQSINAPPGPDKSVLTTALHYRQFNAFLRDSTPLSNLTGNKQARNPSGHQTPILLSFLKLVLLQYVSYIPFTGEMNSD
jgi:hypothetical protein